ncbi:MAG: hypothetical protein ACI9DF_005629 [Verrucomicrobiales bacterium]
MLLEAELSSSLSDFVNQSIEMATRSPDILAEVDHDLDVHGLKKKALRDADRLYFEHTFRTLPGNLVAIQLRWRSVLVRL